MKKTFTDMMGNTVVVDGYPQRIVSLVPSQTELLYDLGLGAEVVGITKFCVHPQQWFRTKKRVGGTKTVHYDIVRALQPDLIIANKEENTQEQVEQLAKEYPVWVSNIQTVSEGMEMIRRVGELAGRDAEATTIMNDIEQGFLQLHAASRPLRVAYYIWRDPWMCAGGDTFISDMIGRMGWVNVTAGLRRYPTVAPAELLEKDVQLVLLSSEPYPFKEKHIAEIQAALPHARVMLVDGEMFSWYGSRMRLATHYLQDLVQNTHIDL
ncbi:helical backbone metal receptor [Nemorincola caseinilytica]|uniref:Helical backbone metal receptor n=1 Tax=Nemorincola caseinilytica TaxID=2054315 RepID=A0ABP8N1W1_9BACT